MKATLTKTPVLILVEQSDQLSAPDSFFPPPVLFRTTK